MSRDEHQGGLGSDISYDPVHRFWFGSLDERGVASPDTARRWWQKSPSFDQEIRRRFEDYRAAILDGECDGWLVSPRGLLSYVIVLDQFSRNMFRDEAESFRTDDRALAVARGGVARGADRELGIDERVFLYMPYMHSEALEVQEECVNLFQEFVDELSGELRGRVQRNLDFAVKHRDIVARFNRFPHRNEILGRESTPEELVFLSQPGSRF